MKRTLYFGNPAYLSIKNKQLLVKYPDKDEVKKASIADLALLVIDNPRITITSPLLQELLSENVALVQCDKKHLPSGLFYNMQAHTEQLEVVNYQISLSQAQKDRLWQEIIRQKIRNQADLLSLYVSDIDRMNYFIKKVSPGDTRNYEGQAAAFYWSRLYRDFIENFHRDTDENGINAGLNYGYAILRSLCARALVQTGLFPMLGLFHSNKYNKFCLADDLMEPYRPWVDRAIRILLENGKSIDLSDKAIKATLLSIPQEDVKMGEKRYPLMKAIELSASSLKNIIINKNKTLMLPSFYE